MEAKLYTLWISDSQAGPYTLNQLKAMWSGGTINANTMFWTEGNEDWQPITNLANLLEPTEPARPKIVLREHIEPTPHFAQTKKLTNPARPTATGFLSWGKWVVLVGFVIAGIWGLSAYWAFNNPGAKDKRQWNSLKGLIRTIPKESDEQFDKSYYEVGGFKFDVSRADSVDSPYQGTVEYDESHYAAKADGGKLISRDRYKVVLDSSGYASSSSREVGDFSSEWKTRQVFLRDDEKWKDISESDYDFRRERDWFEVASLFHNGVEGTPVPR